MIDHRGVHGELVHRIKADELWCDFAGDVGDIGPLELEGGGRAGRLHEERQDVRAADGIKMKLDRSAARAGIEREIERD